ncbi:MAG: NmrA family transcriptional regulator [Ilumatobacteraceae bacterium]
MSTDTIDIGPAAGDTRRPVLITAGTGKTGRRVADGLAVANGVEHVVLLSGRGEQGARAGEHAVQVSGARWTVPRASWFDQNFSEHFLTDATIRGELALPVGDVGEPFVDAADVADVADVADGAVDAIVHGRHVDTVCELTGPRLLSFAGAVAEIAEACGRDIRFVTVDPDDFTAELLAAGLPDDEARGITELFATVLDGRNASTTDGVLDALGRPARDFTDWALAATGAWSGRPMGLTA